MDDPPIPSFAELAADPEIAPLLTFTPVARKVKRPDGWTPELQRELIARIAATGTVQAAVWQMGKHATGAEGLYKVAAAASFRESWDAAIVLGRRRNGLDAAPPFSRDVPGITRRTFAGGQRKRGRAEPDPLPGQIRNERGEWEDQDSIAARLEDADDRICTRLLRCRRLFLAEISRSPGKRAAFEILTDLPIDWDKAQAMEAQPDEPWNPANQRQPDMVLTAESGWSFGEMGYGPDRKRDLRDALNDHLISEGLEPLSNDVWEDEE